MSHPLYGDNPPEEPETTMPTFSVGDKVKHRSNGKDFGMIVVYQYFKKEPPTNHIEGAGNSNMIPDGYYFCRWLTVSGVSKSDFFDGSELVLS